MERWKLSSRQEWVNKRIYRHSNCYLTFTWTLTYIKESKSSVLFLTKNAKQTKQPCRAQASSWPFWRLAPFPGNLQWYLWERQKPFWQLIHFFFFSHFLRSVNCFDTQPSLLVVSFSPLRATIHNPLLPLSQLLSSSQSFVSTVFFPILHFLVNLYPKAQQNPKQTKNTRAKVYYFSRRILKTEKCWSYHFYLEVSLEIELWIFLTIKKNFVLRYSW